MVENPTASSAKKLRLRQHEQIKLVKKWAAYYARPEEYEKLKELMKSGDMHYKVQIEYANSCWVPEDALYNIVGLHHRAVRKIVSNEKFLKWLLTGDL